MKTVLLLISCLFFHSSTVRAARFNDEGEVLFIILLFFAVRKRAQFRGFKLKCF